MLLQKGVIQKTMSTMTSSPYMTNYRAYSFVTELYIYINIIYKYVQHSRIKSTADVYLVPAQNNNSPAHVIVMHTHCACVYNFGDHFHTFKQTNGNGRYG